jgi:hypothetical protein
MAAQVRSISNLQGPLTTEVNMGQIKTAGHRLAVEAIGDQPLAVEGSKKTAGHRLAVEAIGDQPLAVEDSKKTAGHRLAVEAIGDQPLAVEGIKTTAGHRLSVEAIDDQPLAMAQKSAEAAAPMVTGARHSSNCIGGSRACLLSRVLLKIQHTIERTVSAHVSERIDARCGDAYRRYPIRV